MIRSGCGPLLTESVRELLAQDTEWFFVKTHEQPFERYFPGEFVVHLVRHPGGALWSYWNLLKNQGGEIASLEGVIEGVVWPGNWSAHVASWLSVGEILGDRYCILRYEDLVVDGGPLMRFIQETTGFPLSDNASRFPSFEAWHDFDPSAYRSGNPDEWSQTLSPSQKALVWALHADVMEGLGYLMPFVAEGNLNDQTETGRTEVEALEAKVDGLRSNVERLALREVVAWGAPEQAEELKAIVVGMRRTMIYRLMRRLGRWTWADRAIDLALQRDRGQGQQGPRR